MKWGEVSMLEAERRLLANALLNPSNTHFVLLCKASIPLLNFSTTHDIITQAPSSFLSTSAPSHRSWSPDFLPLIPLKDFRRGSAWFALQRRHAAAVVADREYFSSLRRVGLLHGNEEHYLATLLGKLDGEHIVDRSLMYAHFSRAAQASAFVHSPQMFRASDVSPQLLSRALGLQCAADDHKWLSCSLFARRFSEDALQPLMGLLPLQEGWLREAGGGKGTEGGGQHNTGGGQEGQEGLKGQGAAENRTGAEEPLLSADDEELLARAAATEPTSGTPRIAFLFLVRGPLPLARLWAKFFEGQPKEQYSVYVHPSVRLNTEREEEQMPEVFRGRQVPSKRSRYSTADILDADRRLLANALLDPSNTHFVLLCESSVPLFPFPFVYEFFTSEERSFVKNTPNTGWHWTEQFLPLIPKKDWAKGGAWFVLQRRHARMVVADREYYRYFKTANLSNGYDEHYPHTLLWVREPQGLVPNSPMATRWEVGPNYTISSRHPVTFQRWHLHPGFLSDLPGPHCAPGDPLRHFCRVFARKFHPSTLEPLLRLLPLPKVLTPEEVDHMAQQWWESNATPKAAQLAPSSVPGAGRATGSYLETWEGQLKGDRRGGGGGEASHGLTPEQEELFGRALAVVPGGAPRVAFLFLLQDTFLLAPLWAKFFEGRQGEFSVYVYARSRHCLANLPEVFAEAPTAVWEDSTRELSAVEGARHLLATALLDPRNSQFLLLCEASAPLFNFSVTFEYITQTPFSFVDAAPGVREHWQKPFEALFPSADWGVGRVGEPWFMLQRPHAAMVVSDIENYRAFKQAALPGPVEARSYFSTLMERQDPGTFFRRSLVYARWPSLSLRPSKPMEVPVTFFFWDVLPGLISDMASPRCAHSRGSSADIGSGEGSMQPCFLFARRFHGDALVVLLRVLPARDVPYLGWGPDGKPYQEGTIKVNPGFMYNGTKDWLVPTYR